MLDFSVTFLFTIINITFLFLVLRRLLFTPVSKFMSDRSQAVLNEIQSAKKLMAESEALKAEFTEKMKAAGAEALKIIDASREKAATEAEAIIQDARIEAARIIEETRKKLEEERRLAEVELRHETADISINAASRVLGENIDSDKNRRLVEAFLAEQGVA